MSRASARVRWNIPVREVHVDVSADGAALEAIREGLRRLVAGEIHTYTLRVGSEGLGQSAFVFTKIDIAPETTPLTSRSNDID